MADEKANFPVEKFFEICNTVAILRIYSQKYRPGCAWDF